VCHGKEKKKKRGTERQRAGGRNIKKEIKAEVGKWRSRKHGKME
jgi:hypothetical protein